MAGSSAAKSRRKAGPTRSAAKRNSSQPTGLSPAVAFPIFFGAAIFAALYSPIQDCDEVFNYWDPSHYLNHGYGLQTWEYSPVYAIRSWAYAGVHSTIIAIGRLMSLVNTKSAEFYFLRFVFAFVCAICETRLFSAVARALNPRLAIIFMIIMVTSTGMFHASTAYLPSTFAMYTTMLGTAAFVDRSGGQHTASGILWFAVGASLGWPFAGALVLPFIFEEVVMAFIAQDFLGPAMRVLDGAVRSSIILALQVAVDFFFYKKLLCIPWNIVAYNVFGANGKGPDIYGTEPWHFYVRNLILNFNVWFILATMAIPITFLQHLIHHQSATKLPLFRNLIVAAPFYLWQAIFTSQPHKEERFMYPAYPLLALNAAMTLHVLLTWFGSHRQGTLLSKIPSQLKALVVLFFVLATVVISGLRVAGMISAYSAPLKIYAPLEHGTLARPGDTLCLGKEWYRFPSSYFLPNGMKAKFVKSEFRGLLPGEFSEATDGFGLFPGTWLEPSGMNDENKEDPGKYTDLEHCTYLVDSYFPGASTSKLEPNYINDTDKWDTIVCDPFLDASNTGAIGRMFWLPESPLIPEKYRRRWGQYCLLRQKHYA